MEFFNRAGGLFFLLCSLPVYPLIWFLIKLDDGGSLFYRGERLGLNKKPFTIYKFRTLSEKSEEHLGGRLLPVGNGFETRVGKFLRDSRLDEIPQLWNVVRGDMHLVGPRPVRPSVYNQLCRRISGYDSLFTVKPGLTGFAQFYTPYHTDKRIRLRLDMLYLSRKSVALDAGLFFSTIISAVRRLSRFAWRFASLAAPEWKAVDGVVTNRRELQRRRVPGEVQLSFSQGENGRSRIVRTKAQILDLNEKAVALLCRRNIPPEAGELQLIFRIPFRRGRQDRWKVARSRGRVFRRVEAGPASRPLEEPDHLFVVRYTPAGELDSYKIDKYLLRKSVADG